MRSFSTFSPIGTQGANRTPDVGAKLLVPSVWVREPRLMVPRQAPIGHVRVQMPNGLMAPRVAVFPGKALKNIGSHPVVPTVTGTGTREGSSCGLGYRFDTASGTSTSNAIQLSYYDDFNGGASQTALVLFLVSSVTSLAEEKGIFAHGREDGSDGFYFFVQTDGRLRAALGGWGPGVATASAIEANKCYCGVIHGTENGTYTFHLNGTTIGQGSAGVINGTAPFPSEIGRIFQGLYGHSLNGIVFSYVHWNYELPTAYAKSLSEDPMQIFVPA